MKNQLIKGAVRRLPAEILAAMLAAFWAVVPLAGATVEMTRPSDRLIEITGGRGRVTWRLRYGTQSYYKKQVISGTADLAWFSHSGWLRLIDAKKGIVVGRWLFPGQIVSLVPVGSQVRVEVEALLSKDQALRRTFTFDPTAPVVPYWPNGWLLLYRLPEEEWASLFPGGSPGPGFPAVQKPTEETRKVIAEAEEAARRDPCSPWLRVILGNLYRGLGDARAGAAYQEAVRIPTTDFSELVRISSYLENLGESDAARAAFERGYRDFLDHGNDPRLFTVLIGRLFLYGPTSSKAQQAGAVGEERRELNERIYKLQPYGEASELGERLYADYLSRNGRAEDALLWRARAEDAEANSLFVFAPGFSVTADRFLLLAGAGAVGIIFYFFILFLHYRPQHRLTLAAQKRPSGFARSSTWFYSVYWSRSQRVGFLAFVFAVYFSAGMLGQYIQGMLRFSEVPISFGMGSLSGPVTTWYLENRMPKTPDRDLLLAIAYQQGGESDNAGRLYRDLPQFAESWNNLGVILKNAGKVTEARQAFEKALQLDPALAEAALNLGQPPRSFWTEEHQKYFPGRPMLAPPRRERMVNAFLGGSPYQIYLRALITGFSGQIFSLVGKLAG